MQRWHLCVFSVALVVGGCSSSNAVLSQPDLVRSPPSDLALIDEPTATPSNTATPARTPGAEPDGEPTGGVLRLAVVGDVPLDPLEASPVTPTDMVVVDLLYDSLTVWDVETGSWAPGLATDFVRSEDGLSWAMKLAEASFSDGTPITAGDVQRSFERILGGELTLAAARLDVVKAVVAVDFITVRFDLREPYALLPHLLSSPLFGIVPQGDLDGSVGSGPMVLAGPAQLRPRGGLELAVGGVDLVAVETDAEAAASRDEGVVDIAYVSPTYGGTTDASTAATAEVHFALNVESDELSSAAVRRAVVGAVTTAAVTNDVFGQGALPIDGLHPTALICVDPCGGDAPIGLTIGALSVAYVGDPTGSEQALANAVVAQLSQVGIEATAAEYDLEQFIELVGSGRHDLVRTGWVGLFPSPDSQLAPYQSDSPDNVSAYSSDAFDDLLRAARASGDPRAFGDAGAALEADAPVLPIARLRIRVLLSAAVEGLQLRHDGTFDVARLIVFS